MPRISFFHGIGIWMYWDEAHHRRPHFHARYAGQLASLDFDGNILVGSLPPRQLRLVREWSALHRDELVANWERTRRNEPLVRVDPLP